MKLRTDSLGRRIDAQGYVWITCEMCGLRFAWTPDQPDPPCIAHQPGGTDMAKTNAKEIREKKAKREGSKPKNFAEKLAAAVPDAAPKLAKQLAIPGTLPKVHKDVEAKGDAFQEALAHCKRCDKRLEEAKAALISTMKTHKLTTYRYQDVELLIKAGNDQVRVRELDKEQHV